MKTRVRDVGDVRILDLEGKITIGLAMSSFASRSKTRSPEEAPPPFEPRRREPHRLLGIGEMVGCFTTLARKAAR